MAVIMLEKFETNPKMYRDVCKLQVYDISRLSQAFDKR